MAIEFLDKTGLTHLWGKLKSYFVKGNGRVFYGTCSTAAATAVKAVTATGFTASDLIPGAIVCVKFTNTNSAATNLIKMNVNDTGAFYLKHLVNGTTASLSAVGILTSARVHTFVFDGTYWMLLEHVIPPMTQHGQSYSVCSTPTETAEKAVTISGAWKTTGGILLVKFEHDVEAGASLKLNTTAASPIYYNDTAIVDGIIKAGDIVSLMYYSSAYRVVAIDRWGSDIEDLKAVAYTREVIVKDTNVSGAQITWYCKRYADNTVDCYGVVRPTLSNYSTISTFYAYYIEVDLPYTMANTNYHADASWKIAGGLVMNGGDRISYSTTKMRTYAVSPLSGSQSCDISIYLTGLKAE